MTSANSNKVRLGPDANAITLSLIATGIIQLSQQIAHGAPMTYPYPPPMQRGLDRLAVALLQQKKTPPAGVPELLQWCQRPLMSWGIDLEEASIGADDCLLDNHLPTAVCEEWAVTNPDVEAEITERKLMKALLTTCQISGNQAGYVAIRRLLIDQPVMTHFEFQRIRADARFATFDQFLTEAYIPAPSTLVIDEHFVCCKHCGNLLQRTRKNRLVCENARCAFLGEGAGRTIPAREQPVWLQRALRRYVAAPGQTEVSLAKRIESRGISVDLWPGYDSYDLRITFPDNEVWAVDVKDWANPFLLARQIASIPGKPYWTVSFFVFPDERKRQRPDYLRAFQNHCTILSKTTRAMFARQFLHQLDRKAKEVQ